MSRPRILIVDDDSMVRSSLARILRARFDVLTAENGAAALVIIEKGEKFDVILTDVEMPVMDGRKMLERLELLAPEQAARTRHHDGRPARRIARRLGSGSRAGARSLEAARRCNIARRDRGVLGPSARRP